MSYMHTYSWSKSLIKNQKPPKIKKIPFENGKHPPTLEKTSSQAGKTPLAMEKDPSAK